MNEKSSTAHGILYEDDVDRCFFKGYFIGLEGRNEEVVILETHKSHSFYPAETEEFFKALSVITSDDEVQKLMRRFGATDDQVKELEKTGRLVRYSRIINQDIFESTFENLALVSRTGNDVRNVEQLWVDLVALGGKDLVPVPRVIFEFLGVSTGVFSIPALARMLSNNDPEVLEDIQRQLLGTLPILIEQRLAALVGVP